jgi:Zn-finger protein
MFPPFMLDPPPGCTYDHEENASRKLRDLITMFPYHLEGSTCAPSYAPYFAAAAELVGEACASFAPQ